MVAGGTGSGKSVFISFFILELLRRQSKVYICDPKNSDLGSLAHYLGTDYVATNSNNIARIVRLTVEEMNRRYEHMREIFQYGSNFADHNFNMTWLIFDEMGAFQASGTDKKSKEIISEVMDGIKQIILLGRQAVIFRLVSARKVSAYTLNTDLRDNLGLRIALGANSSEGYRMVFGSATPPVKQPSHLVELLTQWKTIQKHELARFNIIQSPEQLVFTYINTKGNVNSPMHVDYLNNKMKSVERRHPRLKHATPHKLRHTGATLARQAGMSLEAISETLTHSDTITIKTYVNTAIVVPLTAGQVAYENLARK